MLTVDAVNVAPEPPRLINKTVGGSPAIPESPTTVQLLGYLRSGLGSRYNNDGHLNMSEGECSDSLSHVIANIYMNQDATMFKLY